MISRSLVFRNRKTGELFRHFGIPPGEDFYPQLLPHQFLWHYLKFEYLQGIVAQRTLWVNRLDKMPSDPFDGVLPKESTGSKTPLSQTLIDAGIDPGSQADRLFGAEMVRKHCYPHCWTVRIREDALMWAAYCPSVRSVAIRTTYDRLLRAVGADQPSGGVVPGEVKYVGDSEPRPDWSDLAPAFWKRKRFHTDKELRLLYVTDPSDDEDRPHVERPVDPLVLIERVVVHPIGDKAFLDEVKTFLGGNGINVCVAKSKIRPSEIAAAQKKLDALKAPTIT
jgi:hypothetical protein